MRDSALFHIMSLAVPVPAMMNNRVLYYSCVTMAPALVVEAGYKPGDFQILSNFKSKTIDIRKVSTDFKY